jgi:hypothetical protein
MTEPNSARCRLLRASVRARWTTLAAFRSCGRIEILRGDSQVSAFVQFDSRAQGKRLNRCSRADHVSYAQIWCTLSRWSSGFPYDDWASSNCASSSCSRTAHSCAYGPKKLTTFMPSSRTRQPSSSPMMTKTRCFIGPPYGKHQAHDSLPRATSAYMRIVFRDTEAFAGLKCQRKTT